MDTPGKTSSGVMEIDMAQGMPTRLCAMCNWWTTSAACMSRLYALNPVRKVQL